MTVCIHRLPSMGSRSLGPSLILLPSRLSKKVSLPTVGEFTVSSTNSFALWFASNGDTGTQEQQARALPGTESLFTDGTSKSVIPQAGLSPAPVATPSPNPTSSTAPEPSSGNTSRPASAEDTSRMHTRESRPDVTPSASLPSPHAVQRPLSSTGPEADLTTSSEMSTPQPTLQPPQHSLPPHHPPLPSQPS